MVTYTFDITEDSGKDLYYETHFYNFKSFSDSKYNYIADETRMYATKVNRISSSITSDATRIDWSAEEPVRSNLVIETRIDINYNYENGIDIVEGSMNSGTKSAWRNYDPVLPDGYEIRGVHSAVTSITPSSDKWYSYARNYE